MLDANGLSTGKRWQDSSKTLRTTAQGPSEKTETETPFNGSVCFQSIADIAHDLHCCSVKPQLSFAERVGRSSRRGPLFSMWGGGALLVFMGLLFLLSQAGDGGQLVLWLDGAITILFVVWFALVWKWSRKRFLQRVGHRRRHSTQKALTDQD